MRLLPIPGRVGGVTYRCNGKYLTFNFLPVEVAGTEQSQKPSAGGWGMADAVQGCCPAHVNGRKFLMSLLKNIYPSRPPATC